MRLDDHNRPLGDPRQTSADRHDDADSHPPRLYSDGHPVSNTSIAWQDVGLKAHHNLKRVLITDSMIAAAALLLLCVIKLLMMRLSPGFFDASKPFFNWRALTLSRITYPLVVFLQELVSRGFVHESMPG